jgi:hypothetical protein
MTIRLHRLNFFYCRTAILKQDLGASSFVSFKTSITPPKVSEPKENIGPKENLKWRNDKVLQYTLYRYSHERSQYSKEKTERLQSNPQPEFEI